ncbi:Hypothetical protein SMAX5B_009703 [Scophthalmus maximus]|uniref:Uncharacterized protein n=1 Tax=Scophthalmus maximus TaxID=52904 RepID=A0A2U9CSM6_SCOMX|nr:Hypothetical protein SMAX5B_009703 [Scophthalmus maximus]
MDEKQPEQVRLDLQRYAHVGSAIVLHVVWVRPPLFTQHNKRHKRLTGTNGTPLHTSPHEEWRVKRCCFMTKDPNIEL